MNDQAPIQGLGDAVAKAIEIATAGKVKPCEACKKRKAKLNQMMPFGKPKPIRSKP